MFQSVSIKNFKSLRDVSVDLEPFTVFVGPNGSGKSSVLQAIDLLCRVFDAGTRNLAEAEIANGLSRGATEGIELAAEACGGVEFRYRTPVAVSSPADPSRPMKPPEIGPAYRDGGSGIWTAPGTKPEERRPRSSAYLRLQWTSLTNPEPIAPPSTMLVDGSGLHSALADMALNDPDSFSEIQEELRRIVPSVRRLRHATARGPRKHELLFDMKGAEGLPAYQVSEGTLLILGVLYAFHAPSRPGFILLDDIDRALHPKAQEQLVALLRRILANRADVQILATTHSPYLLDALDPQEVRMTILDEESSRTRCDPLKKHPMFERWKDEMATGEMWSLFGESWMLDKEVVQLNENRRRHPRHALS